MARPGDGRKPTKQPVNRAAAFDSLKPDEAREVLRRLLEVHPKLRAEAEAFADAMLHAVSFESIANEVESAVTGLDEEDMYGHSGGKEWGYVDPGETAWDMLDKAIGPFQEDMERRLKLGFLPEAEAVCKGIVLGLYRVRDVKNDQVLEEASDFPAEAAGMAVDSWAKGSDDRQAATGSARGTRVLPADFVQKFVPEWASFLTKEGRKR